MTICVKPIGLAVLLLVPNAIVMSPRRVAPLYPADGIYLGGNESVRTSDARRPHRFHYSGGVTPEQRRLSPGKFLRVILPPLQGCAGVFGER